MIESASTPILKLEGEFLRFQELKKKTIEL